MLAVLKVLVEQMESVIVSVLSKVGLKSSQPKKHRQEQRKILFFFNTWAELLNTFGPGWGLVTCVSSVYLGYGTILPDVYAGWPDWWLNLLHIVSGILLTETCLNWLFLRVVDNDLDLRRISPSELQAHIKDADQVAKELQNPSNRPLKSDDQNTDVVLMMNTQKLSAIQRTTPGGKHLVHLYPYLSWRPCPQCNSYRPPRAHHCPLCKKCVLKRDHHCFFSGTCVGLNNLRYFVMFSFYVILLTYFSLVHSGLYIYFILWEEITYSDFFLPFTIVRWLMGLTSGELVVQLALLYSLIFMAGISTNMFAEQCDMIMIGWTAYEKENELHVADSRGLEEKLMSVFGKHWWLAALLPTHRCYPTTDDGLHWPHIVLKP